MVETELLTKVKQSLGITGTYQDETLNNYIDEIKSYLLSAGVKSEVLSSSVSIGVISRGVSDLWNYGSGEGKLSEYFYQRAMQLRYYEDDSNSNHFAPIQHLCSIELDSPTTAESKNEIILVNNTLYGVEMNITFKASENWYKDTYYKIGRIVDKKYWPVSNRILIGALFANNVESAKQNFFKLTTDGSIHVYSDFNIIKNSTVKCVLSDTYM